MVAAKLLLQQNRIKELTCNKEQETWIKINLFRENFIKELCNKMLDDYMDKNIEL